MVTVNMRFFTELAHWADTDLKLRCLFVCLSVCQFMGWDTDFLKVFFYWPGSLGMASFVSPRPPPPPHPQPF